MLKLISIPILTALLALAADQNEAAAVPKNLEPPPGETLAFRVLGSGDQVYVCRSAEENGKQSGWILKAPDAKLLDGAGKLIGRHFAGPSWEASDGSQVKGKLLASDPSPEPDSIPWLLLVAVDHSGTGMMSKVTSIQRVHTHGGRAPANGCDPSHAGGESRVHYTADYLFYSR